jgi:hypothetical protein
MQLLCKAKLPTQVMSMNGMKFSLPSFKRNRMEHINILRDPLFIDDVVGGYRQRRIGSVYKSFSE